MLKLNSLLTVCRGLRRCSLSLLALAALASSGLSAQATSWPSNLFAPYVDFTAWPPYDIVGAATNTGLRYVSLAFVVADTSQDPTTVSPTNIPAWGGYTAYSTASAYRLSDINTFRGLGGDVVISFGGQSGTPLAGYITNAAPLQQAYQSVIDNYSATRIDFDIEGTWADDLPSINLRSSVMKALQDAATASGKTLEISLTLAVFPSGLQSDSLYVVQAAVTNGVNLSCVNIMAMDYGDDNAPNPSGQMGTYAIMAATNLFNQLKTIYQNANIPKTDAQLWQMVGITPMIGVNDVSDEVFEPADATNVAAFAQSQDIGMIGMWSLNRDQSSASGVSQTPFEFTEAFLPFGSGVVANPIVTAASAGVLLPTNGSATLVFPVTLSIASTNTVTVGYFTSDGTATSPSNYVSTNGTLVFNPGQTAQSVSVLIPANTNSGPNETFTLNLTNAVNAEMFSTQVTGTITNENSNAGGGNSGGGGGNGSGGHGECAITSQWLVTFDNGSSFQATLTLSNPNNTNITINTFAFEAPYTLLDWVAAGTSSDWVDPNQNGNEFTVPNGWPVPAVVPANGTLQLLFQGAPGDNPPSPADLVINGITVGDCGIVTAPVYFTSAARSGNDIVLTWQTMGGATNWVQVANASMTGWSNASAAMVVPGSGAVVTNWTLTGAATNGGSKFYRVQVQY